MLAFGSAETSANCCAAPLPYENGRLLIAIGLDDVRGALQLGPR